VWSCQKLYKLEFHEVMNIAVVEDQLWKQGNSDHEDCFEVIQALDASLRVVL
jgi:hypothetical protein